MVFEIDNHPQDTLFLVALPPEMSPAMRPGTYLATTSTESREVITERLTEARQNGTSVEFKNCWLAIMQVQMIQHPQAPGQVQIMHACHVVPFSMFDVRTGSDWVLCPQQWVFPAPELDHQLRQERERASRELGMQKSGLVAAPANALQRLRQPQ